MSQSKNLPSIDLLRSKASSYGTEPYWFGLGFIQLKLDDLNRMHFWCPEIPHPEREEIHNHRYNFSSRVLAGKLHHSIYHLDATVNVNSSSDDNWAANLNAEWELFETNCEPGKEGTVEVVTPCLITHVGDFWLEADSLYEFPYESYHTTEGTEFAITYLTRSLPKTLTFASVIKKRGQSTSCPFKDKIPAARCWEYIDCALGKS